ncbi:hypothetical protein SAMN05421690_10198 [Nitrosomonas sp. Nm51]|nr:hypothetical protein SAMN05421690_10198 [Nitrosomonas sp. Nm51]
MQDITQFTQPEDLLKTADSALYTGKNEGRNQIVERQKP